MCNPLWGIYLHCTKLAGLPNIQYNLTWLINKQNLPTSPLFEFVSEKVLSLAFKESGHFFLFLTHVLSIYLSIPEVYTKLPLHKD